MWFWIWEFIREKTWHTFPHSYKIIKKFVNHIRVCFVAWLLESCTCDSSSWSCGTASGIFRFHSLLVGVLFRSLCPQLLMPIPPEELFLDLPSCGRISLWLRPCVSTHMHNVFPHICIKLNNNQYIGRLRWPVSHLLSPHISFEI